jgi:hypothetical protein
MSYVVLTVADHERNGFIALARWPTMSEVDARAFIQAADDAVTEESEPDIKTASFTFVLDLMELNGDCIDTGKKCLPTQIAMKLAPDQVRQWLDERPDPDSVMHRPVPTLSKSGA